MAVLGEYNIIWQQTHPVDWLRVEYAIRRSRNANYSLRAFARFLHLPSGPLSEILAKKRKLTPELGRKISARLGYGSDEAERFLELIVKEKRRRRTAVPEVEPAQSYRQLELDKFALMSEWYHYALLSLMETRDFVHEERWMAGRLGISLTELRRALECLQRLGMVQEVEGKWIGTGEWATPSHVPSIAGRNFEKQGLQKAIDALDAVPLEERDVSSMTMAVDPTRLKAASDMIRSFRRELTAFLEQGDRTEVYRLNVQLFPLSRKVEA